MTETVKSSDKFNLTEEGWKGIESQAKNLGISGSELWEKIGSGELVIINSEELEDLFDTISDFEVIL